uniref:SCY1-like protein 2 n=1 Tax=Eptatretus burgeri TaxID=7764 RepID=A0A8C4QAB1_EPTBU
MTEFVNPNMVPFVLPNVLLISEECSRVEYTHLVLPELIPIFKLQEPIQVLLIFLQKMDLLLTKTPAEDIKQHVLPMIFRALEAPSIQIQELCLNIIPTFANLIESSSMKNSLFPRIKNACLQTSSLAVRVNALVCMGKLLQYLEKWFVLDEVLPFLQLIPSKEPAVLMAILGIYKCTFSHKKLGITKEILAGKVLPHLVPLSIESSLNLSQFNSYIVIIKEMVSRIETEQRGKLEQLQAMHNEQKNLDLPPQLSIPSEAEQTAGGSNKVLWLVCCRSLVCHFLNCNIYLRRTAANAVHVARALCMNFLPFLLSPMISSKTLDSIIPLRPHNKKTPSTKRTGFPPTSASRRFLLLWRKSRNLRNSKSKHRCCATRSSFYRKAKHIPFLTLRYMTHGLLR